MAAQASFLLGNWLGGLVPASVIVLLMVFILRRPLTPMKCTIAFLVTFLLTLALTNLGNGNGSFSERLGNLGDPTGIVFVLPPALLIWAVLLVWGWSRASAVAERTV